MTPSIRTTTLTLVLVLASSAVWAQAHSFLTVTVVDKGTGEPIPGVAVKVTCPEDATFEQEFTTNKKGRFDVAVHDGTLDYEAYLEKEGYQTIRSMMNPEIAERTRLTIEMTEASAVPAGVTTNAEAIQWFDEAVEATKAGDLATAREKFEAAAEAEPKMSGAHSALAGIYLEAEEYDASIAAAERVLELTPQDPRALRIRYEAYRRQGDAEQMEMARRDLETVENSGDMAAILFNEGAEATKVGDFERAEARFRGALERDPELVEARSALAITLYQLKRYVEAEEAAEAWLTLAPDSPEALRVRYESLRAQGKEDEAEEALVALSAASAGGDTTRMVEQARSLFERGDSENAVALLRSVIASEPEHALAHYLLGLCYLNMGQTDDSRSHLETFLELAPTHPEAESAQEMLNYL